MTTGYKVFSPDFTCRGHQYEVGQTYTYEGKIAPCRAGFHFCLRAQDCFSFYDFDPRNRVAEVEALGLIIEDGGKSVTDKIRIVREIPWAELLEVVNAGKGCTGLGNSGNCNSGNWNSGDRNSGNWNSGNWNSGDRNSGNWNSGNCNSGNCNSGDRNSGNCNSGNWNSGDRNSGNWNSGDRNSGFFNRCSPLVLLFEKPTTLGHEEISQLPGMRALRSHFRLTGWVPSEDMTAEEKTANPQHETTGGFLRVLSYKEACAQMWEEMNEQERRDVMAIPNFDPVIFKDITGIRCSNCGARMLRQAQRVKKEE